MAVERRAAFLLLALFTALLAQSPAPAAASPSSTGKYYVVSRNPGVQRESLYGIAARTLGDGQRSQEIFDLNKGRAQPGGGRLTDPLVLEPGWILILPRDAKGPGVRTGSPPVVPTRPPPSAEPSVEASAPAAPGPTDPVILFGAVGATFVLLLAVFMVRGGRRRARPAPVSRAPAPAPVKDGDEAGPPPVEALVEPVSRRPPERLAGALWPAAAGPVAAAAGSTAGTAAAGTAAGEPGAAEHDEQGRAAGGSGGTRPASADGTTTGDRPGVTGRRKPGDREGWPAADDEYSDLSFSGGEGDDPGPAGTGESPAEPVTAPAAATRPPEPAEAPKPAEKPEPGAPPTVARSSGADGDLPSSDHVDAGRPSDTPPEDPPPGSLSADLVVDGGRVTVSLVGVSGDGPGIPYGWRSAGQAPPVAALPVMLGDQGGRRLHLDLGRCPDVLTVTGALPNCEKYALRLIRQLLGNGHGVAVVGEGLFGGTLPDGCRRVPTMADVRRLSTPGIVVCGSLTGPDIAAVRLSRASGGPTPVIIGEVPRSRWSLRVEPA